MLRNLTRIGAWLIPSVLGVPCVLASELAHDESFGVDDVLEGAPPSRMESSAGGYFDVRLTTQKEGGDALFDDRLQPTYSLLSEGNVSLKLRWGDSAMAFVDASFFYQRAWWVPDTSGDEDAYRPFALISEAFLSLSPSERLHVTIGKKRVVWGPGIVINPTDLLNPPKDPTDPALQRTGAWLSQIEWRHTQVSLSAVFAARTLREHDGVPSALLYHELEDPDADGHPHYALALRAYALVANTDLNLIYYLTNRYADRFERKSRIGAAFSRLIGDALEIHGEALVQSGSARPSLNFACFDGDAALARCADRGSFARFAELNGTKVHVAGLLGGRYLFEDGSMLSAEFLLNTDGLSSTDWKRTLEVVELAKGQGIDQRLLLGSLSSDPSLGSSTAGAPVRYQFSAFRRRYLFVNFMRPRIFDDFAVLLTLLSSLEDFSGQVVPQVNWSPSEWSTLSLAVFVPFDGLSPTIVGDKKYSEFTLFAYDARVLVSARLFY